MAEEPRLDANDIQGNILPGFRRRSQLLLGYSLGSEGALREALSILLPYITPMTSVMRQRAKYKAALTVGEAEPEVLELWVNIAIGAAALDRLGENGIRQLDKAFDIGMRPARTGDPWSPVDQSGNPNPWHPSQWVVGKPAKPLDLLLILAFDDWSKADGDKLISAIGATGVEEIYREEAVRLPGDIEHFGFADGISQIGVRGEVEIDGDVRPVTTRYGVPSQNGVEYGRPGQPLAWPSQFLVGAASGANSSDPAPARYRNGSFLVFRRLSQDVRAFDEDTAAIANDLGQSPSYLRAAIVGRWPSGPAIMRHTQEPSSVEEESAINYFAFGVQSPDLSLPGGNVAGAEPDPAPIRGLKCPAFAHIRKVNPRDLATDLGDAQLTQGFQMLRRGIPFGPSYDRTDPDNPINNEARGLLFLAYQRAPSLQFERLNSTWMNRTDGPGPGGFDLLVGQRVSPQTGAYSEKNATLYDAPEPTVGRNLVAPRNWVRPSGGAYLFAPSLGHIAKMVAGVTHEEKAFKLDPGFLSLEFEISGLGALDMTSLHRHDGETIAHVASGHEYLISASWPETSLPPESAAALHGVAVSSIDLSGMHFPTVALEPAEALSIALQSDLHSLKIDGTALSGQTLAALLASLPNLQDANLAGIDIDDADVATLLEARSDLVGLSLGLSEPRSGHRFAAPRLSAGVISKLAGAPALERLSLRGLPIGDQSVLESDVWERLVCLDLGETSVSDISMAHLTTSPKLRELRVDGTAIGDIGAANLLKRRWMKLDLSWTQISQSAMLGAKYPEELLQLGLAGLALDDGFATFVTRARVLETIDLSQTGVSAEVAAALGRLPNLKHLKANVTQFASADIPQLLEARLQTIEIEGIRTEREARRALAENATLRRASLSVDADWDGLEAIRAELVLKAAVAPTGPLPPNLRELSLGGDLTKASAKGLAKLRRLNVLAIRRLHSDVEFADGYLQLQSLYADNVGLNDRMLREAMALPSMTALYVSGNSYGTDAFLGSLSPAIHTLELRESDVDDNAIPAIAELPRLHCIDLPGTKITSIGVSTLARTATNLQSIALDAKQIDHRSVDALGAAPRLTELYLYGNDVTTATIAMIVELRIRELVLIGTSLGDDAVPYLAAIPGLRSLSLGNELSSAAIASLQALRPQLQIRAAPIPLQSFARLKY